MDIQELKSIWTKIVDEEGAKYQLDQRAMEELVTKKSKNLIGIIKKNLNLKRWYLGIIGISTTMLSLVYVWVVDDDDYLFSSIISSEEMGVITFLLGIIILALFSNVLISYKKIVRHEKSSENLKTTLESTVSLLKKIISLGIYSDTFGVPFFAGWLLYRKLFKEDTFTFDIRMLYLVLSTVAIGFFSFYLNKYVKAKKFGPYLTSLQNCIEDINYMEDDKLPHSDTN